jgi:hypothetical protein
MEEEMEMRNKNRYERCLSARFFIFIPLILLIGTSHAQPVVDSTVPGLNPRASALPPIVNLRNEPRNVSAWVDTSSDSHFTYVAALRVAPSIIKDPLGHEPTPNDLLVLKEANNLLDHSDERGAERFNQLCADFKSGNSNLRNGELASYGYEFNQVDVLIAEDVYSLYEETLSKLSTEAAEALNQIRENMSSSSSRIDWQKYAELSPEKMREEMLDSCR